MIRNSFALGPEGWHSYDYHGEIVAGAGIYVLTTWQREGGVNNSGFIWSDQSRWSTDVPERPISILALIHYRSWVGLKPIDLRQADVSVYLRGDDLRLYGAECYFWVHAPGTRWHFSGRPIPIADGHWAAEPSRFRLENDESLWHRSYSSEQFWGRSYPAGGPRLDSVLGEAHSYGFAFVGFSSEVKGRLSMAEFEILPGTQEPDEDAGGMDEGSG